MTTTTRAPATPSPPPQVDLETRLELVDAAMDVLLDAAAAQFAIRTAHIAIDPVPAIDDIADLVPLTPTLVPTPSPYGTPLADLLHRARIHVETHGWLRGGLREDHGTRRCPLGAIRIEAAGNRHQADDACVLLLEAIQRDFPDAHTVPSWNDQQTSPAPVLLYLGKAADLAHHRNI
jgi:hypothetical protein